MSGRLHAEALYPVSPSRDMNADILRGLAMFLLVWGHAIQYGSLGRFDFFADPMFMLIYSFHLPLFAMVSGYLASGGVRRRSGADQLSNLLRRLVLPLIAWSVIIYVVLYLIPGLRVGGLGSVKDLGSQALQTGFDELWFLWVLVACNVIVVLVHHYLADRIWVYALIAVLLALVPWNQLGGSMLGFLFPFFAIGYVIRHKQERIARFAAHAALVCVVAFPILLGLYSRDTYIYISGISLIHGGWLTQLELDGFRFLIGLAGCGTVYTVVCVLGAKIGWLPVKRLFAWFGANALVIYAVQNVLLTRELQRFLPDLTGHRLLFDFVITPLIGLAVAAAISLVAMVIRGNGATRAVLLGGR